MDQRIDEVARALTDAPAPDRLAGRVLDRINQGEGYRWWNWTLSPMATGICLAALLVLASMAGVVWGPRHWRHAADTGSSTSAASRPAAGSQSPQQIAATSPALAHEPPHTPARESAGSPATARDSGPWSARGFSASGTRAEKRPVAEIDALDTLTLAPLALERIPVSVMDRPDAIQSAAIDIAPLAVPRLTMDEVPQG
jgi:hypothetical protein